MLTLRDRLKLPRPARRGEVAERGEAGEGLPVSYVKDQGLPSGDTESPTPGLPEDVPSPQDRTASERVILCAACEASITSPRHRIASHGSHEHRFMNPAGLTFHIGCYAVAVGCTTVGPPSREYAWFPGYAWRLALCAQCGRQLGWHFRADDGDGFFGLILDRLRIADSV